MMKFRYDFLVAFGLFAAVLPSLHAYFAVVNSTDHTEMHIVPAPGPVTLDGDLKDWDLSGAILMKLDESSQTVYAVRGAMMYDRDALYIGAQVKDPTPMLNNYAFTDDMGMTWNADAIQIRFVSDPSVHSTATLQSGGSGLSAEQARFVCHLTLWYSTRDEKPGLFICYTLGFSDGQCNPAGVQAAYRKDGDGKGYAFEYRVPWSVLRAPRALTGGDQVQLQWQMHWGTDMGQGLKAGLTDVRNPNSPDLGYMGPGAWGKGILEKTGNIQLTEKAGGSARPQGHIPIRFRLDRDSKVSLAICDASGRLVRTCLGAKPHKAGDQTYLWDGLDDRDQPLPAGAYTTKFFFHTGVGVKFITDVGSSGTPPYQTEDGTGGWAGDYGAPQYVAIEGDRVFLGTMAAEAAPATICTNLEGRKLFGTAARGGALALHKGFGYFIDYDSGKLVKFEQNKGFLSAFRGGKSESPILQRRADETDQAWGNRRWQILAMAVIQDTLVASSYADGKLLLVDLETGAVKGEADLPAPWGLAAASGDKLFAVSGNALGCYDLAARAFTPIARDLDAPRHLASDADGNLYVSLQGATQQVWKLAQDGKVLFCYGKPGGRPALGKFDSAGLLNPYALGVDRNGRLWVCEADGQPKRYSVWNPDGSLYKDFYGSQDYSTTAWVDPSDPRRVFAQQVRYIVDYEKGEWKVDATVLRAGSEGKVAFLGPDGHAGGQIIHYQGRSLVVIRNLGYNALYEEVGDLFVPRLVITSDRAAPWWVDRNNDGHVQDGELLDNASESCACEYWGNPVDESLNFYFKQGDTWHCQGNPKVTTPFKLVRWEFKGFNEQGGLEYGDPKHPTVVATDDTGGSVADVTVDAEGCIYALVSGGVLERGTRAQGSGHRVAKYGRDGRLLWEYHVVHCAFAWTSENYFPGYIVGPVGFSLGSASEMIPLTGYYGQYFLLDTKDGLFVDVLGDDQRSAYTMGPQMVLTENFNGTLFRHPGNGKVYFIAGDADCRIWELTGLDTLKRQSSALKVSAKDAERARENARVALAAELSKAGSRVTLKRLANAAADGKYDEWSHAKSLSIVIDAERSALAQIGYDDQNLYARFQIQDDSPLVSTPTDYKLLFKAGDAVEIQLGTDMTERKKAGPVEQPAVGDLRLVVSRTHEGQVVATLYRPRTASAEKPHKAHFESPTGSEDYDEVSVWNDLPAHVAAEKDGYIVELAVPWERLGVATHSGNVLGGDLGVIYGNRGGTRNAIRYLWSDKSPEVSINNDIPSEVRIHPSQWGRWILE